MSGKRFFFKMRFDVAILSLYLVLWLVFRSEDTQVGFGVLVSLDDFCGIAEK